MQKNIKISEDNRGFSLLELIVTVVILAIVTAPFLSSFVTASNTNVKSKRIQEANELSQYVIEQCKAMSLDKIESEYGVLSSWNKDGTGAIDGTEKNYNKLTTKYEWTIDNTKLPAGYSDKYTADVVVKPVKAIINSNEAMPVIDNVNKKNCTVLKDKINKCNLMSAYAGTVKHLVVTISYDSTVAKKYKVNYEVKYTDLSGLIEYTKYSETFSYEKVPDIYLLYATMSSKDTITVINEIPQIEIVGEGKSVNVYLMEQDCGSSHNLSVENISFQEDVVASKIGLNELMYGDDSIKLDKTIIYTNVTYSSAALTDIKDKDDTVNNTIKSVKIDTLYDIDVRINYSGKEVSTFKATKIKMK